MKQNIKDRRISLLSLFAMFLSIVVDYNIVFAFFPCSQINRSRAIDISVRRTKSCPPAIPSKINALHMHSHPSMQAGSVLIPAVLDIDNAARSANSFVISENDGGGVGLVLLAGVVIAASIFIYANVVYTPEIVKNAQAIRDEEQTRQILGLVRQLKIQQAEEGNKDLEESKNALEAVFGKSVEDYVASVDDKVKAAAEKQGSARNIDVSDAEQELVGLLRSIYG